MSLWRRNFSSLFRWEIESLASHFGEEIGAYFRFMSLSIAFLAVPAIVSLAIFLLDTSDGSIDSFWPTSFGLFMFCVWGPLFVGFWSRAERNSPQARIKISRPEFEPKLQSLRRIVLVYAFAGAITLLCLLVAVAMMLLFFNCDGYFTDQTSPVYLTFINSMRNADRPGLVYEDDFIVVQYLPTVIHSGVILLLNMVYKRIAIALTRLENHQFVEDFDRSVLLKRIPFELFDCFISLFYLLLWEQNIARLRHELLGLFITDTLRRVFMESLLPYVSYRVQKKIAKGESKPGKDSFENDCYDEFVEILAQYGYIMLFASIMPLASCLALVANLIEIRSDLFKLLYVFKFEKRKASGVKIWIGGFKLLTYCASFTNAVLYQVVFQRDSLATFVVLEHTGLFATWTIIAVIENFPRLGEKNE